MKRYTSSVPTSLATNYTTSPKQSLSQERYGEGDNSCAGSPVNRPTTAHPFANYNNGDMIQKILELGLRANQLLEEVSQTTSTTSKTLKKSGANRKADINAQIEELTDVENDYYCAFNFLMTCFLDSQRVLSTGEIAHYLDKDVSKPEFVGMMALGVAQAAPLIGGLITTIRSVAIVMLEEIHQNRCEAKTKVIADILVHVPIRANLDDCTAEAAITLAKHRQKVVIQYNQKEGELTKQDTVLSKIRSTLSDAYKTATHGTINNAVIQAMEDVATIIAHLHANYDKIMADIVSSRDTHWLYKIFISPFNLQDVAQGIVLEKNFSNIVEEISFGNAESSGYFQSPNEGVPLVGGGAHSEQVHQVKVTSSSCGGYCSIM